MRFIIASFIVLISVHAFANTTDVSVEGVITQFDSKVITLKQVSGAVIKVPRSSYPTMKGIVVGKTNIKVNISSTDFLKMNQKHFKAPPSKPAAPKK